MEDSLITSATSGAEGSSTLYNRRNELYSAILDRSFAQKLLTVDDARALGPLLLLRTNIEANRNLH
jgi:hypothetical protein